MAQATTDPQGALQAAASRLTELDARISKLSSATTTTAPAVHPTVAAIGKQIVELATSPNPKVAAPLVKGIEKSLSAQAKADAKLAEVRQLRTPRERLAALKAYKHDAVMEENAAHQASCAKQRDEIIARARAPFTKK